MFVLRGMKYICHRCSRELPTPKGLSNHVRWCEGRMSRESYIGINLGPRNGQWKGSQVGLRALHDWIKYHKPKAAKCANCGNSSKPLEMANISGEYHRDVQDFQWLCRRCHMKSDGRLERLALSRKGRKFTCR